MAEQARRAGFVGLNAEVVNYDRRLGMVGLMAEAMGDFRRQIGLEGLMVDVVRGTQGAGGNNSRVLSMPMMARFGR